MSGETLLIETNYGPVRGLKRTSDVGYEYISFRGIPYAKPPIGELRFSDPQPADAWIQPINCFEAGFSAPCIDMLMPKVVVGNENCLTLNVYTKELSPRRPLPVMVWIHGGAFKYGDSSETMYGPDYLLQNDVVYVSMNYRLGVLGFLSIDDPSVNIPGNAGLKDQTLALKWIRENVQHFGGDNRNITLFGESAGGASVHAHMVSDFSKGLFDKAIVQSGSAVVPWCNGPRNNWAKRLARKIGWDGEGGPLELVEFLREADVTDLIRAADIRNEDEKLEWVYSEWLPTTEPYVAEQSFFNKNPLETYMKAWGNKIPLIIGGTTDEGLLVYRDVMANSEYYEGEKAYENTIPKTWNLSNDKLNEFGAKIKTFYFGENECTKDNLRRMFDLFSDPHFLHGMHLSITGRIQDALSAPTYFYRFAFAGDPKFNNVRQLLIPNEVKGVCHGEDLASLWKTANGLEPDIDSAERKTINRMAKLFTSFAATGNPNCDLILPVVWKPIENQSTPPFHCLNIEKELSFIINPEAERMAFWDSLFKEAASY